MTFANARRALERRRHTGPTPLVAAFLVAGCASPPPLAPRVVRGLDDTPLEGASSLVVSVLADGAPIEGAEIRVPLPSDAFVVPEVPLGRALALRVEAFAGEVPLARGRSLPFDYASPGAPPAPPDVLLVTLGRFTRTLESSRSFVAVAPSAEGAILVADDGEIFAYLAHGGADGSAVLVSRGSVPARRGARWTTLRDETGAAALLGVGGLDGGASVIDTRGATVASLPPDASDVRTDIALASTEDGAFALAAGGVDASGAVSDAVSRFELEGGLLVRTELTPLAHARAHAELVLVSAEVGTDTRAVALVGGGGATASLELLDPYAGSIAEVPNEQDLDARAWVAVGTGLVVAAGGMDRLGAASDAVDLFLVRPDRDPPVARVTPSPSPLFAPRSHAQALQLGPGLAIFVSGTASTGAPVRGAELVEVRLDALPGEVVPTGSFPIEAAARALTRLEDRSVLVVGDGLVLAYVPPRGPE